MSVLSDDTDVLLLIPPDFFLVPSDSDEEVTISKKTTERLLVSDLITQVNDLEGRICMIESKCMEEIMTSNGNLRHLRHYGSADTLNIPHKSYSNSRSLQATPMKSYGTLSPTTSWRTSDNSSSLSNEKRTNCTLEPRQNILMSNDYLTQKEKDAQLLKEIDDFFKQKRNKHDDVSNDKDKSFMYDRGKSPNLTTPEGNLTSAFNLNKVNDLLKKLDETQKEIEEKLKLKELTEIESEDVIKYEYFENESEVVLLREAKTDNIPAAKSSPDVMSESISDNTKGEVRNPRRALKFDESPKKDSTKQKIKNSSYPPITNSQFHCGADEVNCMNNKTKSLSVTTEENSLISEKKIENKLSENPSKEVTNLLSLSNLWGSNANMYKTTSYEDQQILKQRLQEERCRRRHCEELIQQLQLRLLEEQQKIAVAVKVDQEKDQAISKLTEGWNKLVSHWRDLESQRNNLAKKLLTDREKFKNEMSAACQTVKRYEAELSKALDLAHGYKEKCEMSDKEKQKFKANLQKEAETMRNELREAVEKLHLEEQKTEKLEKQLSSKEEFINQNKGKLGEFQNQMKEAKKNLKEVQTELEIVKHEKEKLVEKLKEEKNRISNLEQNKKSLQHHNEELKKKEKSLKEEVKGLTEQMEKVKVELKEFYQEQVENIVQEKLKEFQDQLAAAEKTLQKEIEMREKAVTEMAVKQVQQIVEKHVMEVNLLEEKHKEEIELWKIQVAQCEEKMDDLRKKLEQHSNHKSEMAQKLQTVMEAQWQEALKIITASSPQQANKSPLITARSNSENPGNLTRQNTFTMTSSGWGEGSPNKNGAQIESRSSSPTTTSDAPFCKDGLLTCREQSKGNNGRLTYRIDETPQKMTSGGHDHLKKYIQVLLERAPGRPTDESNSEALHGASGKNASSSDNSTLQHWQHVLSDASSSQLENKFGESSKSSKENKPPWK